MSCLPLNTILGKLNIVEVLDWYDGPRLFIAENASGSRYVAFWADEIDGRDVWLYSPVSESRIEALVAGKIDLRSIYEKSEDGIVFLVKFLESESYSVDFVSASEIEEELLPPVNDFVCSDDSSEEEADFVSDSNEFLVHEITVKRPRSKAIIPFEALASVATRWSTLIHSVLDEPPVPVGARIGSLTFELQTAMGPGLSGFLRRLRLLVEQPSSAMIDSSLSRVESKRLELFLESLNKEKLTLSTRIMSDSGGSPLVLSHAKVHDLRLALIEFNQSRVESVEVPQADDLKKVFKILELIKSGEEKLGYSLALSTRQVYYYKQASRILGLLNEAGSLTSRGQYLVSLSLLDRYEVAMLFFESSPVGFAWLRFAQKQSALDLDPYSSEDFLRSQCTELAATTVARRGQTLRYWVDAFQQELHEGNQLSLTAESVKS